MQYTRYFSQLIKQIGMPTMSIDQFNRMMNIVVVEAQISALQPVVKLYPVTEKTRYIVPNKEALLKKLTCNKSPQDLMLEFTEGG